MSSEEQCDIAIDGSEDDVQRVPIFSQLSVLAAVILLLLGAGITPKIVAVLTPQQNATVVTETIPLPEDNSGGETVAAFTDMSLVSDAVFVWDISEQRVLYQENADTQLPLASITKLMTALVANELLSGTSSISISEMAINQDGASGLRAGERFTLANLSDLLLLTSSNDGAYAVAETLGAKFDSEDPAEAFVALMNIRAEELGLGQTYFRNPTGLDITTEDAGAYGSARDVAFLMEHIITEQPDMIEATTNPAHYIRSQTGETHTARNTNQNVLAIPGIVGSKTGYTELAGGNLVIAFDAGVNRPIVVAVLGSTWQGRFDDVQKLVRESLYAVQY